MKNAYKEWHCDPYNSSCQLSIQPLIPGPEATQAWSFTASPPLTADVPHLLSSDLRLFSLSSALVLHRILENKYIYISYPILLKACKCCSNISAEVWAAPHSSNRNAAVSGLLLVRQRPSSSSTPLSKLLLVLQMLCSEMNAVASRVFVGWPWYLFIGGHHQGFLLEGVH
jgi:hypothetical protein